MADSGFKHKISESKFVLHFNVFLICFKLLSKKLETFHLVLTVHGTAQLPGCTHGLFVCNI
jgi:hypothetical protein